MTVESLAHNRLKNREKQSTFRQRRKEYIKSLEDRIRHLQSAGSRATAELQAAARHVDAENKALLSLLRDRFGLTGEELLAELHARRDGEPLPSSVDITREGNPVCPRPDVAIVPPRCRKPADEALKKQSVSDVGVQTELRFSSRDSKLLARLLLSPPLESDNGGPSSSSVPCDHAFRMIRTVNVKEKDIKDIIIELSPGFRFGCAADDDEKAARIASGGGNECAVDSHMLFKVLNEISEH